MKEVLKLLFHLSLKKHFDKLLLSIYQSYQMFCGKSLLQWYFGMVGH